MRAFLLAVVVAAAVAGFAKSQNYDKPNDAERSAIKADFLQRVAAAPGQWTKQLEEEKAIVKRYSAGVIKSQAEPLENQPKFARLEFPSFAAQTAAIAPHKAAVADIQAKLKAIATDPGVAADRLYPRPSKPGRVPWGRMPETNLTLFDIEPDGRWVLKCLYKGVVYGGGFTPGFSPQSSYAPEETVYLRFKPPATLKAKPKDNLAKKIPGAYIVTAAVDRATGKASGPTHRDALCDLEPLELTAAEIEAERSKAKK